MREMKRYRRELGAALVEWDKADAVDGDICGLIEGTDIDPIPSETRGMKRKASKEKR